MRFCALLPQISCHLPEDNGVETMMDVGGSKGATCLSCLEHSVPQKSRPLDPSFYLANMHSPFSQGLRWINQRLEESRFSGRLYFFCSPQESTRDPSSRHTFHKATQG